MLANIKRLFHGSPAPDFKEVLKEGGIILDVRSQREYAGGHIKGSKNIPLQALNSRLGELGAKDRPVITCCSSGMRSASAKSLLKSKGFDCVYNGGGWNRLQEKIK